MFRINIKRSREGEGVNPQQRDYYLKQIGVIQYHPRQVEEAVIETTRPSDTSNLAWDELQSKVSDCHACPLASTRIQTVFGAGAHDAELFIVGEAPGADEDQQGVPFVGRAGRLLNSILFAAGYTRDSVYIGNILKCRPPENRDPRPEEVEACQGYLKQQIGLVSPKAILAVGRVAAQNLLQTDAPLATLRGKTHTWGESEIPVVVTYHPAYLLRQSRAKAEVWKDLLRLLHLLKSDALES
jgi:uracil-DNA glycosylase family 4